jgi:immunity protein 63 of polymorphic toxin system
MKTLQDIEMDVAALARRIGTSPHDLPTYGTSRDGGYPHVELHDCLYHYVVVERGQEIERRSSASYYDLLYWIFRNVTHGQAFLYEIEQPH